MEDNEYGFNNNDYERISAAQDFSAISTVLMLRHFYNTWGIEHRGLIDYFHTNKQTLYDVCNIAPWDVDVRYAIAYIDDIRKEYKNKPWMEIDNKLENVNLHYQRENFCGVGTRRIKIMLNNIIKKGNEEALLYRLGLEIEDRIFTIQETNEYCQKLIIAQKQQIMKQLVVLCKKKKLNCGIYEADEKRILCYELPDTEQLSFELDESEGIEFPKYDGMWDGKLNTTFEKIEKVLVLKFSNEIEKIKKDIEKKNKKKTF